MRRARALAAAQTIPKRGDVAANVEQHLAIVELAAREEVRVVVFPELSLVGYELDAAAELAFSPQDARLTPLLDAASRRAMTLVVGAPLRMSARLHIAALILSPEGEVGIYTKRHLGAFSASASVDGVVPPAERTVFVPGDCDPLLDLGGRSAAIAVCADTGCASHPRRAAERGATSYLASMFVIPSELARETANLRACARRHSMAVVFSNFGGPSGGLAAAGASAIWSEEGELLVQLEDRGAGVAVAVESPSGWRSTRAMLES